jgi:hypothetical protein
VAHALVAGGEPADPGRRDERFVVVDDAVEELDGEPAGVRRGDQSPNPTLVAFGCRPPIDGEAGRLEFGRADLQRSGIGQFPTGERQSLDRLGGSYHHAERSVVDLHGEPVAVGDHPGAQQLGVPPPGVDVPDVDPDVSQPSNVHASPGAVLRLEAALRVAPTTVDLACHPVA